MPHPSPDCIWAESEYDTCLALGYSIDQMCEACKKVGQERLLKAIFPNGPPENVAFIQVDEGPTDEEVVQMRDDTVAAIQQHDATEKQWAEDEESKSIASFDLPSSSFPFDILFLDKESKKIYNEIHVTGPGVMDVAPGHQYNVKESEVHIRFADGTTVRSA